MKAFQKSKASLAKENKNGFTEIGKHSFVIGHEDFSFIAMQKKF
jgi:hypothetical protein